MALELYNTMEKNLQEFIPIVQGSVGFYGCGPTVYNYAHIGNLRAYVFQDTLKRSLTFLGFSVKHVMNITDIGHLAGDADDGEDKMVKTAQERGSSVLEIAQFYTDAFFADTDRLNILRPSVVCKATDHVPQMISLIEKLEKNNHTYMSGGNLYFDISTFPEYGKLARLNLEDLQAGARIDIDQNKKNPYDFVLWFTKSKFENQALTWDSPWGRGYPGWHIECSAMSMHYLGEQFDIHTGGIDHIPIHHTNEIAQSEGATGKQWVRYWLHNEFLVLDKGKMSKSSGSFLTLQNILDEGYDALDYRYFLLGGHYRSQLAFSWESMESAKNARKNLLSRIVKICEIAAKETEKNEIAAKETEPKKIPLEEIIKLSYITRFKENIEQDLSTPRAISELQALVRDQELPAHVILSAVAVMDEVLGLQLIETANEIFGAQHTSVSDAGEQRKILALIEERVAAKKEKNFQKADEIRNQLKADGILLEDSASGTTWKRI